MIKKTKGQKSKDKILDIALELFTKNGYSQTSAQEIADLCGISQTTIFYHYKNKKILFLLKLDLLYILLPMILLINILLNYQSKFQISLRFY